MRPPLDSVEAVRRVSEPGAYDITFHDNDVFPFGAMPARKQACLKPLR